MSKYLEEQRKLAGITKSERGAFSSTGCMEVARPLPSTVINERQDDEWIMKLPRDLRRLFEYTED